MNISCCTHCGARNDPADIYCRRCNVTLESPGIARFCLALSVALAVMFSITLTVAQKLGPVSWEKELRVEVVQPRYARLAVSRQADSEPQWVRLGSRTKVLDETGKALPGDRAWGELIAAAGKRIQVRADWSSLPADADQIILPPKELKR